MRWTHLGLGRMQRLRAIVVAFHLGGIIRSDVSFDRRAHDEHAPADCWNGGKLNDAVAAFWRQCIRELDLVRTQKSISALMEVGSAWASECDQTSPPYSVEHPSEKRSPEGA